MRNGNNALLFQDLKDQVNTRTYSQAWRKKFMDAKLSPWDFIIRESQKPQPDFGSFWEDPPKPESKLKFRHIRKGMTKKDLNKTRNEVPAAELMKELLESEWNFWFKTKIIPNPSPQQVEEIKDACKEVIDFCENKTFRELFAEYNLLDDKKIHVKNNNSIHRRTAAEEKRHGYLLHQVIGKAQMACDRYLEWINT